jgi:putative transposase
VAAATVESLGQLRNDFRFKVYVYCLMPDHFHGLISAGESGRTLGGLCGAFKSLSTRKYWNWYVGKLWQRQFFDHIIRNQQDFEESLEYIQMNPVRRGLVERPEDWPYTERLDYLR